MKKLVIVLILIFEVIVDLNSQSDSFFSYHQERRNNNDTHWEELVMLPKTHGLDYNYPANDAPLSSGLLLLVGAGIGYRFFKRNITSNH